MSYMLVFIDESGDHNLSKIDVHGEYNIFVLTAVCFEDESVYQDFDRSFRSLKKFFFNDEMLILHTAEISRPHKSTNRIYLRFRDSNFRAMFFQELNKLLLESKFLVISRIIDKSLFLKSYNYPDLAPDPYNFSFDYLLNQIIAISGKSKIEIYPEKRNKPENLRLLTMYNRIIEIGTRIISSQELKNTIKRFQLKDKKDNDSGLQIADLIANRIGRYHLGKQERIGNEILFENLRPKILDFEHQIFPKK